MSRTDPFEAFKNRREIEILEDSFKVQARKQKQRVDAAFAEEDGDPVRSDKVDQEMEDFFKGSADSVEKALEEISGPVDGEDIEAALERVARAAEGGLCSAPDADLSLPEGAASPSTASRARQLDLRAALERIQNHRRGAGTEQRGAETSGAEDPDPVPEAAEGPEAPAEDPKPECEPAPEAPARPRVLTIFDESFTPPILAANEAPVQHQPEHGPLRFLDAGESEEPDALLRSMTAEVASEETVPLPEPEVPAPAADEQNAPPLLHQLALEVRSLQSLYQVLLDRGVVSREEVESRASGMEPEGESDESLAGLVLDVRQLRILARVLIEKGVLPAEDLVA